MLVDLFKFCKGGAPSTADCQFTGAHNFNVSPRKFYFISILQGFFMFAPCFSHCGGHFCVNSLFSQNGTKRTRFFEIAFHALREIERDKNWGMKGIELFYLFKVADLHSNCYLFLSLTHPLHPGIFISIQTLSLSLRP